MTLKKLQRYLRRVQRHTGSSLQYVRRSIEGNNIERLCNFNSLRNPVLLLQGYGASRRVFQILEDRLRRDGFSVFSLNLGGMFSTFNTNPIPHLAKHVAEKIEGLCKRYGIKEKINIVGHSKGGLIGMCYIKDFKGHRRIGKLITLGTPHHGNPWAMIGLLTPLAIFTKSIRQMAPISPFIRRMNKTPWPRGISVTSIYSKADTICPYPSPVLEVGKSLRIKNVEISDVGHAEFLLKRKVYALIRRELLEGTASEVRSPLPRKKQRSRLSSISKV